MLHSASRQTPVAGLINIYSTACRFHGVVLPERTDLVDVSALCCLCV